MGCYETDRKVCEALGWAVQVQSPSTNPADAVACLEAWCKANKAVAELAYLPSIQRHYSGKVVAANFFAGPIHAGSFCEWCCNAILAAQEARNG